jgi:hypothetical protein
VTNNWIPAFAGMTDTYTQSSFPRSLSPFFLLLFAPQRKAIEVYRKCKEPEKTLADVNVCSKRIQESPRSFLRDRSPVESSQV